MSSWKVLEEGANFSTSLPCGQRFGEGVTSYGQNIGPALPATHRAPQIIALLYLSLFLRERSGARARRFDEILMMQPFQDGFREYAHPPPIDVGIRILRRPQFLVADPVRQGPTCCVVYPGCNVRPTISESIADVTRTLESSSRGILFVLSRSRVRRSN